MASPKVSVVITCHNYGRYVAQSVDSVLAQTFDDFECIVVNDGSTDNSADVLKAYEGNPRVKVVDLPGVGLASAANHGIRIGTGEYIVRLDADDYFDENILLILTTVLNRHPEYGMVYPDYYRVSKHGEVIDQIRQPRVNDEVKLLDRSALAAGALYRRSCFDTLGGYNESLRFQEDYDYWIRFIDRFRVHNVQLPLMYYRQHSRSMSRNQQARMAARRQVKQKFVQDNRDFDGHTILGVMPIIMENRYRQDLPLQPLNGAPLMATLGHEMQKVGIFDRLIVDTENPQVAEVASGMGLHVPFLRPRELARLDVGPIEHLRWLVGTLDKQENYRPDIIVMASYNHPFITAKHIEEAINTLLIYNCDSVISVSLNLRFHWKPGEYGLTPVLFQRGLLTDQKDTIYEERGGIVVLKTDNLKTDSFLGKTISFIEVDELEGLRVDSDLSLWVAEQKMRQVGTT